MNNLIKLKDEIINKKIDEMAEDCASQFEWKDFKSSPLSPSIPADTVRDNFKIFFKNTLYNKRDEERIARGVEIIDHNLDRLSNAKTCRQELTECANRFADKIIAAVKKFEQDPNSVKEWEWMEDADHKIKTSDTIADLLGISFETCGSFYEIGSMLFREKQYEDACCVFQFLSILQPYTYEVWISLGLCHHHLNDLLSAISAFAISSLMNPTKVEPYIYGAECFLGANDHKNAKGNLLAARHFLTDENREFYEPLIDRLMKQI